MPLRTVHHKLREGLGLSEAECRKLMVDTPTAILRSPARGEQA
jgi:hypothetical protein